MQKKYYQQCSIQFNIYYHLIIWLFPQIYYNIIYHIVNMSELDILSDYNEDKLKTTDAENNIMKLPKIIDSPSRAFIQSKAEKRQTETLLPPLKKQLSMSQQNKKQLLKKYVKENNKHGDFVQDIQQKLRGVMENVNKGTLQEDQTQNNEQVDFENAIKLNKQKIKHFMQKNQLNAMQAHLAQQKLTLIHKNQNRGNLKSLSRNDSSHKLKNELKRELSAEHKYSMSRKKEEESKRQINSIKRAANKQKQLEIDNKNHIRLPPKPIQKIKKTRPQSDLQIKQNRKVSVNLFDKLHNLFQHPRNRGASEMKIPNPKKIQLLQKQIKQMNEKLGIKQIDEQQTTQQYLQQAKNTVLDWKRVSYNRESKLKCYHDSTFQKQMDKINRLQQRSNKSLCEYVQQQIELVELGLLHKMYPKIQNHTS